MFFRGRDMNPSFSKFTMRAFAARSLRRGVTCGLLLLIVTASLAVRSPAQTDNETRRQAAIKLFLEAKELMTTGNPRLTAESVRAKLTEALSIFRELGDRPYEGATLYYLGEYHKFFGEDEQALNYFTQSLHITRETGDIRGEIGNLIYLGMIYQKTDYLKAAESYQEALQKSRSTPDGFNEAIALLRMGNLFLQADMLDRALDNLTQALALFESKGDRNGQSSILGSIGEIYLSLGEPDRSLDYFNKSLSLARATGAKGPEASALSHIAEAHGVLRDHQKALEYYELALAIAKDLGDARHVAEISSAIGVVYASLKQGGRALEYLNADLRFNQAIKDRWGEVIAHNYIVFAYRILGENEKAFEHAKQMLSIMSTLKVASGDAVTILYNVAGLEDDRGNLEEAIKYAEAAINLAGSIKIVNERLRTAYFAGTHDIYLHYIRLLMRLHAQKPTAGYDVKALEASERGRARVLLELLAESRANIREGVDPKVAERERMLRRQLNSKAEEQLRLPATPETEAQAKTLAQETERLTTELQQVEAEIRRNSPRYAALTQPRPLTLKEIQSQVLDQDSVLLEYSLGNERSYLWAVTPNSITSYELPKREEIEKSARELYELLKENRWAAGDSLAALRSRKNRSARNRPSKLRSGSAALSAAPERALAPDAAIRLSQMLLGPVAAQLSGKRLLIVADGALQYIPFGALQTVGLESSNAGYRPLISDHEIVTLPSASTLAVLRVEVKDRKPADKQIALLADPVFESDDERVKSPARIARTEKTERQRQRGLGLDKAANDVQVANEDSRIPRLPGTRDEARQILALVPAASSKQALDFDASRQTATSGELSQYRYVHFATHGFLNSQHPELSGIVLSLIDENGNPQDGFLRAHEVYNLKLPAELVVLSACQTGLGKEVRGEGLVGLTRGFMYAGALRVVVSLWSVNDEATAELMVRFYRGMLRDKLRPAAALRAAQVSLLKEKKWQSPFYWAAFTLQGEWR